MNASKYSTGTSWLTSNGSSLRKMFPTTRTRLRIAIVKIDIYDVAIIGGGPAGSTAATLLAKAGRRVIVFEREKFPRFHIGESLLPFSVQTFDRLGVREKLDRTFLPKFGGEIMAACG